MKKPLGMTKEMPRRANQRRTFGPHHLYLSSTAAEQRLNEEDKPVLDSSALVPRILYTDQGSGKEEVKEAESEADTMYLTIMSLLV
jgi:hypothetical protein